MSRPDQELMSLAIAEARKGGYAVRPNPLVGCAIETASGDLILGYHERYGENHAERNAIEQARRAGKNLKGARIAISLEPCNHTGRTPPCVDLLLEESWKEILIGIQDPFSKVNGQGIQRLRDRGHQVRVGILESEARDLNRVWLDAHSMGRAHVTLKMATSLDGKWTANNGESKWISSQAARDFSLQRRSRFDAILTSGGTVRRDNPSLTARSPDGSNLDRQPKVFVLTHDPKFSLQGTKLEHHPAGAKVIANPKLESLLQKILGEGLFDILLESGPSLASHFLEAGLVDRIEAYIETQLLGGEQAATFHTAFNLGKLPGISFEIDGLRQLGPSSLFVELRRPKP